MKPRGGRKSATSACAALLAAGAAAACAAAACARPLPAVPTAAGATKTLTICWREKDEADEGALHDALTSRLRGAGYALSAHDCDVGLEIATAWKRERAHSGYERATMVVRSNDAVVDKIQMAFEPDDVPEDEPDRLAILLVNALNASAKVAALAAELHPAQAPAAPAAPARRGASPGASP